MVVQLIEEQLNSLNLSTDDISQYWMHQANINLNKWILNKLLDGNVDGTNVGTELGLAVGTDEGKLLGNELGTLVGNADGTTVGLTEGT